MSGLEGAYVLARFDRQRVLTAPRPRRADIAGLTVDEPARLTGSLAVWRNHAIEPLQPLLRPYLQAAGLELDLVLGGYDDTLALPPCRGAEVGLVWFDLDRLSLGDDAVLEWLAGRVARCAESVGSLVVVPLSDRPNRTAAVADRLQNLAGVRCGDPWSVCEEAGVVLIDERTQALAGTRVSRNAQIQLARALGTRWLPASLLPTRKMLALDLDETLHSGVLGEDGVDGVVVTPAHARLHAFLRQLASEGMLLALISRNEPEDVERLFAVRRADYGLALDDFIAVEISWGSKADAVRNAAEKARIGVDAVVFVDDNPGELLTVGLQCTGVALVHAEVDADWTVDALRWQPGLWRWRGDDVASLRVGDLAANTARDRLWQEAADFDRYLEELGVQAVVGVDRREHLSRLADLSAKTNQFNLTVARLGEADLQRAMTSADAHVVSVALSDRLSDSGIIALVAAHREENRLRVDELAMSCRAMGRGLESLLVSEALRALPSWDDVEEVCFVVRETERNQPARRWLANFAGLENECLPEGEFVVGRTRFDEVVVPGAVSVSALKPNVSPR